MWALFIQIQSKITKFLLRFVQWNAIIRERKKPVGIINTSALNLYQLQMWFSRIYIEIWANIRLFQFEIIVNAHAISIFCILKNYKPKETQINTFEIYTNTMKYMLIYSFIPYIWKYKNTQLKESEEEK